jgi:predicted permease
VAEEFIILSALTLLVVELELYPLWAGMLLGFFIHLLIHVGQFLVYRRYVPVILTSLPSGLYCLIALHDLNLYHPLDWKLAALWSFVSLIIICINLALALKLAVKLDGWLVRNLTERS